MGPNEKPVVRDYLCSSDTSTHHIASTILARFKFGPTCSTALAQSGAGVKNARKGGWASRRRCRFVLCIDPEQDGSEFEEQGSCIMNVDMRVFSLVSKE